MKGLITLLAAIMFSSQASVGNAAEVKVLASGGFRAAYLALLPGFEEVTGHKVVTEWGASIGSSHNSIPNRLLRGELADVLILSGDSLDQLTMQGKVVVGSRVDLANSTTAIAQQSWSLLSKCFTNCQQAQ
jgi:molybdate transport system substrate-binding protein